MATDGWRELAEAAQYEPDPQRLSDLVHQLIEALDHRNDPRSREKSDGKA